MTLAAMTVVLVDAQPAKGMASKGPSHFVHILLTTNATNLDGNLAAMDLKQQ